jgi:thymidine kinase
MNGFEANHQLFQISLKVLDLKTVCFHPMTLATLEKQVQALPSYEIL